MQNFFIRLKVCCVPSNVRGSEKKTVVVWHQWLWKESVVKCGNWNVRHSNVITAIVQSDHLLRGCMLPVFFRVVLLYTWYFLFDRQPVWPNTYSLKYLFQQRRRALPPSLRKLSFLLCFRVSLYPVFYVYKKTLNAHDRTIMYLSYRMCMLQWR